jgi:hypothetical protein
MIGRDPNVSRSPMKPDARIEKRMPHFSALARRRLLRGCVATALSAVMPAPGRAEGEVPRPIATNLVVASRRRWNGRDCLSVELAEDEQEGRLRKTRSANAPSFAVVHRGFADGVIEVDIGAELTGKGAPDVRGFAGLSFHIDRDLQTHESIYLRMSNGRLNQPPPPPPRIDRAIQYVAIRISISRLPGRSIRAATRREPISRLAAGIDFGSRSRGPGCAPWSMVLKRLPSTTCTTPVGTAPSDCSSTTGRAAFSRTSAFSPADGRRRHWRKR